MRYFPLDLIPLQLPHLLPVRTEPHPLPHPYVAAVLDDVNGAVTPLVLPLSLLFSELEVSLEALVVVAEVIPAETIHGVFSEVPDILIAVGEDVLPSSGALAIDIRAGVHAAILEVTGAIAMHFVELPPSVKVGPCV